MRSGTKMMVLLLCLVAISGLFLPQVTIEEDILGIEIRNSVEYIKIDTENMENFVKENSFGITTLVFIVIAIMFLFFNANALSLMSLTIGGTLVIERFIALIITMKSYNDSGLNSAHYGIGFYILPLGIIIAIFIILFNLNGTVQNNELYASDISYSSLNTNKLRQTSNYNQQSQSAMQSNYGQTSFNDNYPKEAMPKSVVDTNIFNQPPVAVNQNQVTPVTNGIQPNAQNINCPNCGTLLNNGMQVCSHCGCKIN